jgi:hypothetical protein
MEAETLIARRLAELRSLTFAQASALPEAAGQEIVVAGRKCALTTFRQNVTPREILVTVQVARRTTLGFGSRHTERGLIFTPNGSLREASRHELLMFGG